MSDIDILDMDLPFDEGEDLIDVHMYDIDSEMIPEEESGQTDCSSEDESVDSEPDEEDTRNETLELLEDMVLDVLRQLSDSLPAARHPQIRVKKGHNKRIVLQLADRRKNVKSDGSYGTRCIRYPQNTTYASSKSLAQLFRIVDLMHEAITDGVPTTKRDMFYKDVQLFGKQSVVDKLVDDVAATIGVGRADLHVRASAKGLFCGTGLTMHVSHDDVVHGNLGESTLIPPSEEISRFEISDDLSWVLIVEKEAVFQTLCHLGFSAHPTLPGPGIIITGKGYPDVATRQFVCTLSNNLPPRIPILAIVDADPYGIDILSVYKYGSRSMAHEQDSLAASRVKWIGVIGSELAGLAIDRDELLPITKHDERKAFSMLRRPTLPRKWRKELQHMLHNRRKAEIEILFSCSRNAGTERRADDSMSDTLDDLGQKQESSLTSKSSENSLVQYLVAKIEKAVADCVRKCS